ncbi:MAG: hypothetical protein WDN25_18340 [Acetobacteraceae bacterium]
MHIETSLPDPLARDIFNILCGGLPPPVTDAPAARAIRDEAAMAAAAALNPVDAFEARLAARIVAMDAHVADCLRSAGLAVDDPDERRRCRAQATSMSRQSDAALRALLRIQATREKQEAAMHPAAMERAGYWFQDVSVPLPPPSASQPEAEPPPADPDAEAATYVVMYPDRAARIRAAGGLPARLDFGPPEPAIVAALLRSAGRHQNAA